jgi:molybdopterin synthase catalytic subunit
MEIKVLLFATLRQMAGWKERTLEVGEGASLGDVLSKLTAEHPALDLQKRTIYAAVNEAYAQRETILQPNDVVAIFPPVSGGAEQPGERKRFELTTAPLTLDDVAARVSRPDCGAIATFAGIVRGETATAGGPRGTDFLDYEAYSSMAEQMLAQIGDEIMAKWPKVKAVSILHRTGRCEIGEPSVVIAVATPHRGDGCFDACSYAIERLKAIVPIWKQENWSDGQVWVEGPRQPELALTQE